MVNVDSDGGRWKEKERGTKRKARDKEMLYLFGLVMYLLSSFALGSCGTGLLFVCFGFLRGGMVANLLPSTVLSFQSSMRVPFLFSFDLSMLRTVLGRGEGRYKGKGGKRRQPLVVKSTVV